ncbi:FtsX-like permease family protein [Jannaschia rubra]|uniref:FtsX-like permease family protein n=1 Tax=Jannaschia rubra TaxID=282197 RepID=A0A0M6XTW6_9RHOB|nr:ABC transporter permease [Jannaschia rubra]CTQ33631.1 FtsX-like permease family protein [Jannaschia rubra]SFG05286.1 putative ABC transport system permease protein [Jannaschia rubra]
MNRAALKALTAHWWRHPLQLVTLVVGLALATGLWTGVQAINAQARLSYDRAAATLGQSDLPRLEGALTLADFATARRAGWRVTPVLEGRLPDSTLRILGIDPFTAPPSGGTPDLSQGDDLTGFLAGNVIFAAPDARLPDGLPPARVSEALAPGIVLADIAAAQGILGTDTVTRLLVLPDQRTGLPPLTELLPGTRLVEPQMGANIARLTDSFHLNLTAFGLLAFVVGLFIVHAAIGLAFEQRRPLFRTLRALGLPASRLTLLLAVELLGFTLVSGALGILLGYVVAALLLPGVAATLAGLYGAGVAGSLSLSPVWWLSGFAMAGAGLALAGGQSLWQLAHLPVLAPAMPRAWARARAATLRRQAVGGGVLLLLAGAIAVLGDGLVAGFACLGALLLGAALLLPPLLSIVLDLGTGRAKGAVAQWLWADARQQVPGLSLALMALLLALAANIGVGTMVGSFRATFTGFLDQRLAAELYVYAADPGEAQAIRAFVAPRVDAVLPVVSVDSTLEGAPGQIYGQADHATFRDNWPLLDAAPGVWDRLAAGEGALINEQLARRTDLWSGERVDLGSGGMRDILGVYSDYGNPLGQAILTDALFREVFPGIPTLRFGLRLDPADVPALSRDLTERFDLPSDRVVDQARIKAFSLGVFEQTFAVTAALNVLTLGVAAFALWASLTTLGTMRVPQVAPVWALGLTRARLAVADLVRALLLAAFTAALAVPTGIALAWVLLAVVNVQAFGWRLPLLPDPAGWAGLVLWSLMAAGLAAAFPAWRLWRMAPADLVKVFVNER